MDVAIILALIAHATYAFVFIADQLVVSHAIKNPYVYAISINILSLIALFAAPWGFHPISWWYFFIALAAGAAFVLASLFFFISLQREDTTQVAPFVGGLIPICTYAASALILHERLSTTSLGGVAFLILGSFLIALSMRKNGTLHFARMSLYYMLGSSICFGIFYTLTKYLFADLGFLNGFIWSRVCSALISVLFFVIPSVRTDFFGELNKRRPAFEWLVLSNKIISSLAFVLLQYTISLASATIVNALQGVQYLFLIALVPFLHRRFPKVIPMRLRGQAITYRSLAVVSIVVGLAVIAL